MANSAAAEPMSVAAHFGPDLKVLVLAGSDQGPGPQPAIATPESPLSGKAFLRLHGRLVIEYVLDVLRECGLTRIWVLAPDHHLAQIPSQHRFVHPACRHALPGSGC